MATSDAGVLSADAHRALAILRLTRIVGPSQFAGRAELCVRRCPNIVTEYLLGTIVAHERYGVASEVPLAALLLVVRLIGFKICAEMARARNQAAAELPALGVVVG